MHATYDPEYAHRLGRILRSTDRVFREFSSRYRGKRGPIHFFWGSFDLAVTRFSGGTMAALGHFRAVAEVMGVRLSGVPAWWLRRTYYLLQMPRWERRLRIVLDWTVALFFRPDITKVDLASEWDRSRRNGPAGAMRPRVAGAVPTTSAHAPGSRMAAGGSV